VTKPTAAIIFAVSGIVQIPTVGIGQTAVDADQKLTWTPARRAFYSILPTPLSNKKTFEKLDLGRWQTIPTPLQNSRSRLQCSHWSVLYAANNFVYFHCPFSFRANLRN
jgi:hypothetical protein